MRVRKIADQTETLKKVQNLVPSLATAADAELQDAILYRKETPEEEWEHHGGICDDIAEVISDVLSENGIDAMTYHIADDNHTVVVAKETDGRTIVVDVPSRLYEVGGWYNYKLVDGSRIRPEYVQVYYLDKYSDYAEDFS